MANPIQPTTTNNQPTPIYVGEVSVANKQEATEGIPPKVIAQKDHASDAREDVPREEVEKAVDKMNRMMGLVDKRLKFEMHEKSHRIIVKIINNQSGEVINEIPAKKVLDMIASFTTPTGLAVDKKV